MGELARYRPKRCIIVIFGASGNLTQRKLAPALYKTCCPRVPCRWATGARR
ncbi:MAG: hypothetical protein KAX44_03725 [Candidatus Brocadiae bacterium]|nr:hypothetical protein [Candidatus Brocadiia bacterium]